MNESIASTVGATPLTRRVAAQIVNFIRAEGLALGAQLPERRLAQELRVSRSPVNSALRLLERDGVVRPVTGGGFAVAAPAQSLGARVAEDQDEALYSRLVNDRLDDRLPERLTENELIRRYEVTRPQLARTLRRAATEGWMERLPGHGWGFLPVLTSLDTYRDSYRFRLAIEPAAILEPGFVLDAEALRQRRAEQLSLIDGAIHTASDAAVFELNSGLHETIIRCSRNAFFIDSLLRLNRLRRLIEYRQRLDREAGVERCREHVAIVDLLLAGQRPQASALMRRHLASVGAIKSRRR